MVKLRNLLSVPSTEAPNRQTSDTSSNSTRISTTHMRKILEELKNERHQKSTRDNYYTIWKNFNKYILRLDVMPKTWEERVALYCAYLVSEKKIKSSTLRSYISAIKDTLLMDGYEWKTDKLLISTLTQSCKAKNDKVTNRLPIQISLLEILLYEVERQYQDDQPYLDLLYKNIFSLAYYGLLRISELALSPHVIKACNIHTANNKDKILILLYSSKTHGKNKRPQEVKIARTVDSDGTQRRFCPFKLSREYLAIRGNYCHMEEQYFIFRDGSPVTASHVRSVLKRCLKAVGLNNSLYGTHSFRIGRATDLAKLGKTIEQIKRIGRWSSNAVYNYIRNF